VSGIHRFRRLLGLAAGLASALLLTPESAHAELGSFYGRENVQFVEARYAPLPLPETGGNYELLFSFVTSSDQARTPGKTRLFQGATAGAGGFNWLDADIQGDRRNAAGGYVVLLYQGYWFSDSRSDSRTYLNWSAGIARGSFWADPTTQAEPVVSTMNMYLAGLRCGLEFKLYQKYFLDVGVGMDARSILLDKGYASVYPVMVTVGVSRWMGPLKHDQFPNW
jgi:hypothetical protein